MLQPNTLCLKITKPTESTFRISTGDATGFIENQSFIIGNNNPNLLWNLLYELLRMPMPVHIDPKKVIKEFLEQGFRKKPPVNDTTPEPATKEPPRKTSIEELSAMSASDIVSKVFNEKGIQITNSLKSKTAIIRKAIKIYENK